MPGSPSVPLTQEEALQLHQRLLAHDPTAANDLAVAYLDVLVVWLGETDGRVPPDIRLDAAEDALVALIRNPQSYAPNLQTLEVYLRMSARGDLRNRLQKERRHDKGRVPWESVELSPQAGKYLGRDDDPALPLRLAEEARIFMDAIPGTVRRKLSATDLRALELIVQKERRTLVYAELWGLTHLPAQERFREVKKRKGRLKSLLKRAGRKR
jgi:hypothetical protein